MNAIRKFALAATAICLFSAGIASANTTHHYSGQLCQGSTDADRTRLIYNSYGVTDDAVPQGADVVCPMAAFDSNTVDIDNATLRFADQSDDVCLSCLLRIRNNSTGTSYTGSTLYSANLTGGATSCSAASTEGYGYLEWTSSELPNSGSSISNVATYAFECTIPTRNTIDGDLQGYTHILGYSVDQVNP